MAYAFGRPTLPFGGGSGFLSDLATADLDAVGVGVGSADLVSWFADSLGAFSDLAGW